MLHLTKYSETSKIKIKHFPTLEFCLAPAQHHHTAVAAQ